MAADVHTILYERSTEQRARHVLLALYYHLESSPTDPLPSEQNISLDSPWIEYWEQVSAMTTNFQRDLQAGKLYVPRTTTKQRTLSNLAALSPPRAPKRTFMALNLNGEPVHRINLSTAETIIAPVLPYNILVTPSFTLNYSLQREKDAIRAGLRVHLYDKSQRPVVKITSGTEQNRDHQIFNRYTAYYATLTVKSGLQNTLETIFDSHDCLAVEAAVPNTEAISTLELPTNDKAQFLLWQLSRFV